ncbi:cytochrome P450 [Paenibacillus humicola]|uniref:cytochrome P450 n=1 Tax=Paenibacillus humicola TaxID=3110540 RepID=UPI00237B305F|nr:cytochrome P450 [Paenibacillus humicola]
MLDADTKIWDDRAKAEWFREYNGELHADPYPFYAYLVQNEPLFYMEDRYIWVAARHEDVQTILKSPSFVREAANAVPDMQVQTPLPDWKPFVDLTANWMLFRDPPTHTRLRGLVSHAFTPRTMERLRPRIRSIADDLAAGLTAESGTPDLIEAFAFPLPVIVIAEMLGVPPEDRELFKGWSNTVAKLLDVTDQPPGFMTHAGQVIGDMTAYFRQLAAERRKQPREDMLSDLLAIQQNEDRLTEDELISNCILLLVAGHETTVNLIGNGALALLRHPEQQERLRLQPELIGSAVEEMLRFESPVQMTGRIAAEDVQIGGRTIRRGQFVNVMLGAANRDPAEFGGDSDRFDIARTPNRHLAFATGAHYCLGAPLARMEGEIALTALFRSLPGMKAADEAPSWRPNLVFRGLQQLRVHAE